MRKILAIYRAEIFSPNSADKDAAIMNAVAAVLTARGDSVRTINEEALTDNDKADVVLTMGRHQKTLDILKRIEAQGVKIVNTPNGIEACARSTVDRIMRLNGLPAAPTDGTDGYWIKRGDEAAQNKNDVIFAANADERDKRINDMKGRGITDIVVTAHVKGDLVKFYGVRGSGFFRTFYPGDDGISKFGDEQINGKAHHYGYPEYKLMHDAEQLAGFTGISVYGGDCIIRSDGSYAIIDFNDWPSFSRCRKEAATAIADII